MSIRWNKAERVDWLTSFITSINDWVSHSFSLIWLCFIHPWHTHGWVHPSRAMDKIKILQKRTERFGEKNLPVYFLGKRATGMGKGSTVGCMLVVGVWARLSCAGCWSCEFLLERLKVTGEHGNGIPRKRCIWGARDLQIQYPHLWFYLFILRYLFYNLQVGNGDPRHTYRQELYWNFAASHIL